MSLVFFLFYLTFEIKYILGKGLCHLESSYGVYFVKNITPQFFKEMLYCILQYWYI